MIVADFADGVGRVLIERPARANSLTGAMLADLVSAFGRLAARPDLRAVILTGAGTVFSAGADLNEARAGLALSPGWERLSARIATMPCLTVAALNGTCAGGAMGMVLACDLRLAVLEAQFFYPVMRLGFLPQPNDPARLAALVGPSRAKMILMAGQRIDAPEALAWGLVDRLVPREELLETALALTADVRAAKPQHVAAIKQMI
ncbi:enoyl-CoA hydratase/isomerase family protein [Paracoccus sp. (in: a-proteobacteria)]|uniref:enoyl-CoA hydratase/isomerase family protein n=1 Tax=Paracoccus sp. TaxID=267 RepID=UPI00321FE728